MSTKLSDLSANVSESVKKRNPELFAKPTEHDVPAAIKRKKGRPEGELQDAVIAYAEAQHWLVYHTYDSRRSQPGFPDLVMLRGSRIVVAELKVGSNKPTPEQEAWLRAWLEAGCQVYEWRESDWAEIERVLC